LLADRLSPLRAQLLHCGISALKALHDHRSFEPRAT